MATINTTPGMHGWLRNEARVYNFYGASVKIRYSPTNEDGEREYPYWCGFATVEGTTLQSFVETFDADCVVSSAQQACADLVLAGLALNELKLTAVSK